MFQDSTGDGSTFVGALPRSDAWPSGGQSAFFILNRIDPANAGYAFFGLDDLAQNLADITMYKTGTGTAPDFCLANSAFACRFRMYQSGKFEFSDPVVSAATGIDLGSTTQAWRNLFIHGAGTYGSHSFKLDGTPTAHRTVTFPDAASNTVQPLTCGGTDKVSAISSAGVITCTADTGGSGSPGGSDKNVQYNNSGAFGGVGNNATATNKYLQQVSSGTPSFVQVADADLSFTDNTTGNVSTSAHGYTPKAPNTTTTFLRGDATWGTPTPGVMMTQLAGGSALTVNQFCAPFGSISCNATENNRKMAAPWAGTIKNCSAKTIATQGGTATTVTLNKNGSSCNISITITANAGAGIFSDNTNTCSVARDDDLNWAITTASSALVANLYCQVYP
jgi:hypothetical protein